MADDAIILSSDDSDDSSDASLSLPDPPPNKAKGILKDTNIQDFFKIKRCRGRPKKKSMDGASSKKPPSRGRVIQANSYISVASADVEQDQPATQLKKVKTQRTNWAYGEKAGQLEKAVHDWDAGNHYDEFNGMELSLVRFANRRGIPPHTFQKYAHKDKSKRRALGSSMGNPTTMSVDEQEFIAQVTARADRGNDPKSRKETIDCMQELRPTLRRKQLENHWDRTALPRAVAKGILKKRAVIAQATTTKRNAITVPQQFRWHRIMDAAFNLLRTRNTGRCRKSGKTFGEVIHHFLIGGDETGVQASAGNDKVYGDKSRKKQEKTLQDSLDSISVYRTGTLAGNTGPTSFIMKGVIRKSNVTR